MQGDIGFTALHQWIGSDADTITWWQMCIRATILFFWGIILIRLGGRRAFGRNTAFDILLAVVVGSMVSRAITATASFFPTLAATAVLIVLHRLLTRLSFHARWVGTWIKGQERRLVRDGTLDREAMRKSGITLRDLEEAARQQGVKCVDDIDHAFIERSGDISIIKK